MEAKDKSQEALELIEKENREFKNHWVWKDLQCTPDEFFGAVKKHVASLGIPPEKWKQAYAQAKDASRVKSLERRQVVNPLALRMMSAMRV